jgi:CHAT domain
MPAGNGFGFHFPRGGQRRVTLGRSEVSRETQPALITGDSGNGPSTADRDEDQALPPGMAKLHIFPEVSSDGIRRFGMHGFCCCGARGPKVVYDIDNVPGEPELRLDRELRRGGTRPGKFVERMNLWSGEQVRLTDWLNECRDAHQGRLELVIQDDTGFRVPWELLLLPRGQAVGGSAAGRLGALVTVTRWLNLEPSRTAPATPKDVYNESHYQARGSVAAYIADRMAHDRSLFDRFVLDPVDPVGSMRDLIAWLKTETDDELAALAMVYVACHGEFSDNPEDSVLGGYSLGAAQQLFYDLFRVREWDTLIFLNGCNTGSMATDGLNRLGKGIYNDGALRGFAKFFLLCGAAGVLATTGAVGNDAAWHMAAGLLDLVKAHPEMTVADAVRRLRAKAAEEITIDLLLRTGTREGMPAEERRQAALANKQLYQLLFPFMYVCYGSPRLRLALTARAGLPEPSELTGTGG